MKRRINIWHIIFWMAIIFCPVLVTAQEKSPVLAFASDTQAPMFAEEIIRKSEHNEKATELIFKDIVTTHPTSLFILGDVVSLGFEASAWKKMDTYLKACADNNIPVFAAFGNHELMFDAPEGRRKFEARFPACKFTGYTEIIDSVAVVLLNSNFGKMTKQEIEVQDSWYSRTITEMDSNPAIKLVIVGCHHSPFTNSTVVSPSLRVLQKFVPAFMGSKKCVLFISGHSHNFEKFDIQGKCFLVIGGGGGPYQPLYTGDKELTHDVSSPYKPRFHYVEVKRNHDSLLVTSRQLKPDFSEFKDGLTFSVTK